MNPDRDSIAEAVKRVIAAEAGPGLRPSALSEDEPLGGELLRISSMRLLGILSRLEDELDTPLPDDLFAGRSYETVRDLVDLAVDGAEGSPVR
ncbi:phosphopantetheine-binding protein [Streptomyces sp. NPDC046759]|uniref:acyl carrier protein n=1 Tax=Streptomyces sp. NPDC046759 TaxID=3155019 RepID=UPI0033E46F89